MSASWTHAKIARQLDAPADARGFAVRAALALIELRGHPIPTDLRVLVPRLRGVSGSITLPGAMPAIDDVEWIADHALAIADVVCPDPRELARPWQPGPGAVRA